MSPGEKLAVGMRRRGNPTVLVVGEEDAILKFVLDALETRGYKTLSARSGREALNLTVTHSGPIHLMIADLSMPGNTGRELADLVQALRPEAKVLYMTGSADDPSARSRAMDQKRPLLEKPVDSEVLLRTVRALLFPDAVQ